eukprot:symbB.v1.2.013652.t1/scaffold966.1/size148232/5
MSRSVSPVSTPPATAAARPAMRAMGALHWDIPKASLWKGRGGPLMVWPHCNGVECSTNPRAIGDFQGQTWRIVSGPWMEQHDLVKAQQTSARS